MSQLTILLKFLSIKLSLGKLFCSHNLKHISNMCHSIRKIVYLNHFSAHTIGAYRTRKQTKGFVIYESFLRFDGLWCKIDNLNLLYLFVKEMMKLQMAAMELENCVPFTCSKFFSLTRETLTAMVATTLTYLVVLIQFQQSAWSKIL